MQKAKTTSGPIFHIEKLSKYGPTHGDTRVFDDKELLKDLSNYKLAKIRYWYGHLVPSGVVNGLKLTFKNLSTGKLVETESRYGNHQLSGNQDIELYDDEYILEVEIGAGQVIDGLIFKTTRGRTFKLGGNGGNRNKIDMNNQFVVGTYGGWGGHLHNFGLYVAPIEDIFYAKRRPYLLLKHSLLKNKDLLSQIKNDLSEHKISTRNPENIFAALLTLGNFVFRIVISYL